MGDTVRMHACELRVRYSETDQMGTFYNSRALEWFECGRTEYLRAIGSPYAQMEPRGVYLPIIEAHVRYAGRAKYDDRLTVTTSAVLSGKARLRFDVRVVNADSHEIVVEGYTVHAFVDQAGKPIRPPEWFLELLASS